MRPKPEKSFRENKAHSRFLESRIYKLVKKIGKATLENSKEPTESQLSKAATANMVDFLRNLCLVLSALRFDFLTEQIKPKKDETKKTDDEITFFLLSTNEVSARAWKDGGSFVVEKGSDARERWVGATTEDSSYGRLYQQLVSQGVIEKRDGMCVFKENYAFNSVSAAASVVTGRQTAGTRAWFLEKDNSIYFGDYEKQLATQQDNEMNE